MGESSELSDAKRTDAAADEQNSRSNCVGGTKGGREGAEVGYNVPFFLRIIAEYVAGILDGGVLPLGSRFILWTKFQNSRRSLSLALFWSVYYLDDWLDHAMVLDSAMKWDEKRQTPAKAMQKKGATFFVFVGVVKNSVRLALRNSLRAKRASGIRRSSVRSSALCPP